jgi:putative ATPase
MKQLNYGGDYKYPHNEPDHFVQQQYLPDKLKTKRFYAPTQVGREVKLKNYLDTVWKRKQEKTSG